MCIPILLVLSLTAKMDRLPYEVLRMIMSFFLFKQRHSFLFTVLRENTHEVSGEACNIYVKQAIIFAETAARRVDCRAPFHASHCE